MKNLLYKELKLAASPLSYFFILFAFMTMIPGYPILVGVFFVCFGIFHTFQSARENSDTIYTALLPIKKRDVVSARYFFILAIEGTAFFLDVILTLLRMLFLRDAVAYTNNVMMNANFVYLGYVLIIYGVFNYFFVTGFYKTAYAIGKPFLFFGILSFVIVGIGETFHHIPRCIWMNATEPEQLARQLFIFVIGVILCMILTMMGWKKSQKLFETIDL